MTRPVDSNAAEALLEHWLGQRSRAARPAGRREAAVLVPLTWEQDAWHLVFTKRSDTVASHRGQVSFPGGHREPGDATLADTAVREAQEEVGLSPSAVRVVGALDDLFTLHDVRITPYVGFVPGDYPYTPDPAEVARIFRVPFRHFIDRAHKRIEHWSDPAGARHPVVFYDGLSEVVWGATARIVSRWIEALEADGEVGPGLLAMLSNGPNPSLDEVSGGA